MADQKNSTEEMLAQVNAAIIAVTTGGQSYKIGSRSSTGQTYVGANPYPVPTYTLYRGRLGMSKDYVKWLQWEAKEMGFPIDQHGGIDGNLGTYTEKVIGAIQVWLDLDDDKKCGPKTIAGIIDRAV